MFHMLRLTGRCIREAQRRGHHPDFPGDPGDRWAACSRSSRPATRFAGARSSSTMKRCDASRRHKGPFYTVLIFTREVGRGSRQPGYRRAAQTKMVATLCTECLKTAKFELAGEQLLPEAAIGSVFRAGGSEASSLPRQN